MTKGVINISHDANFMGIRDDDLTAFKTSLKTYNYLELLFENDGASDSTILHLACKHKSEKMVKYLIEKGSININALDSFGNKALDYAASTCYPYKDRKELIPIIHPNIEEKKAEADNIVELLLEQPGINVDQKNIFGRSPLWMDHGEFSPKNQQRMISLMKAGASLKEPQSEKNILEWAISQNLEEIAKYLIIEGNFDVNTKNKDRFSEFCYASDPGNIYLDLLIKHGAVIDLKFVKILIQRTELNSEKKFNFDIQDHNGETALHIATKAKNLDMVASLLDLGADPNIFDKYDDNPLIISVLGNSVKLVEILLKFGTDPKLCSLKDKDIATYEQMIVFDSQSMENVFSPFHTSIIQENWEIAKLFIKYVQNLKDVQGSTLLHYAVPYNYPQTAESLVKKGQNVTVFDSKARAPIDLAKEKNHDRLVEFFENRIIEIEDYDEKLPIFPEHSLNFSKKTLTRILS